METQPQFDSMPVGRPKDIVTRNEILKILRNFKQTPQGNVGITAQAINQELNKNLGKKVSWITVFKHLQDLADKKEVIRQDLSGLKRKSRLYFISPIVQ